MESIFTPWFSMGMIMSRPLIFSRMGAASSTPSILGTEGPKISASSSPTRYPFCARATARLVQTVLFPTPPLPEATAMMFFTPGSRSGSAGRGGCFDFTVMLPFISISLSPCMRIACSAIFTTDLIKGSFGFSVMSEKLTFIPSMRMSSSTMPADTISCPVPG